MRFYQKFEKIKQLFYLDLILPKSLYFISFTTDYCNFVELKIQMQKLHLLLNEAILYYLLQEANHLSSDNILL